MTPELEFRIDRSTDEAERIARALENVPETLSVAKDDEGYPLVDDETASADDLSADADEALADEANAADDEEGARA